MFPGRGAGTYPVPFTNVVYIEETDFRESDEKGFFGLAPGKEVGRLGWSDGVWGLNLVNGC